MSSRARRVAIPPTGVLLHRSRRYPQALRDLHLAEAPDVPEGEHLLLPAGQRRHLVDHHVSEIDDVLRLSAIELMLHRQRSLATDAPAHLVVGDVRGHPKHPGPTMVGRQRTDFPPSDRSTRQGLDRRVLGISDVAEDA